MCRPIRLSGRDIEAHLISGRTWSPARETAEGCGGLVYWDDLVRQAHVVPALAPDWTLLQPLVIADDRWRLRYPEHAMHQARCDHIWAVSLRRQVDPRLMVAILIQEGTGSFNTNSANAGEYNGNGPDADWIQDTARAVSLVAGKLARYHQALAAGFRATANQAGLNGTAVQFVNWPGPIWRHSPTWGVYAQHGLWWWGVTKFFHELGGNERLLSDYWSSKATSGVDHVNLRCEFVTERADLCSDVTGTKPTPGVVTWVL